MVFNRVLLHLTSYAAKMPAQISPLEVLFENQLRTMPLDISYHLDPDRGIH